MDGARNPRGEPTKWRYVGGSGVLLLAFSVALFSRTGSETKPLALRGLELHYVKAEPVNYLGRSAVRLTDVASANTGDGERLAVIPGSSFEDGTIEIDVTGDTLPNAAPTARGFVGVAFRVSTDCSHYESFYLRPKNGRADSQLQRNHSVQYVSMPDFGWEKLRAESPGLYESYVDLVPAQWTVMKIHVEGNRAQLYVNDSQQPVLIVNDLKLPPATGAIALWIGPGTVAHFSEIKVTSTPPR
jgi:hypothetical protein